MCWTAHDKCHVKKYRLLWHGAMLSKSSSKLRALASGTLPLCVVTNIIRMTGSVSQENLSSSELVFWSRVFEEVRGEGEGGRHPWEGNWLTSGRHHRGTGSAGWGGQNLWENEIHVKSCVVMKGWRRRCLLGRLVVSPLDRLLGGTGTLLAHCRHCRSYPIIIFAEVLRPPDSCVACSVERRVVCLDIRKDGEKRASIYIQQLWS